MIVVSQRTSLRTVVEGYLHHRVGLGWVVDDVAVVMSDTEVRERVYLENVVLHRYEDRKVRIFIEDIDAIAEG